VNNTELLDEFCDNLWLEDGLSRNTLDSYRRDLTKFALWLEQQRGASILQATHGDIQGYLAHLVTVQKAKPSSTGRNISSLKRLFRYLLRQGRISADPTGTARKTQPSGRSSPALRWSCMIAFSSAAPRMAKVSTAPTAAALSIFADRSGGKSLAT